VTIKYLQVNKQIIGGSAGLPAILIEKHRADSAGNIVQIDLEYWRCMKVEWYIINTGKDLPGVIFSDHKIPTS
jgi:DNA-binding GntR family transcriptional regulator